MLNYENKNTVYSLRELESIVKAGSKPILFWVGAGASSWAGYKRWAELAKEVHLKFAREESDYDVKKGHEYLKKSEFPEFFELCNRKNRQRYLRILNENILSVKSSPVFARFLDSISACSPTFIVTTNVDGALERSMPTLQLVQRDGIESVPDLLIQKKSFVLKIHGSIENPDSLVFTEDEYKKAIENPSYISFLKQIFSLCTVVFIGYGLADEYLMKLFEEIDKDKKLFGDGPHFAVLQGKRDHLSPSIKQIYYMSGIHRDHRSAIQVVEEINLISKPGMQRTINLSNQELESAHMLTHFLPPGTWQDGQTLTLKATTGDDAREPFAYVGNGFTQEELVLHESTAMHDLVVGLLCFEKVYLPIGGIGALHRMVGEEILRAFISEEAIKFVYWKSAIMMIYENKESQNGYMGSMSLVTPEQMRNNIEKVILSNLTAVPGKEREAKELFDQIEKATVEVDTDTKDYTVPSLTRGYLLRQHIRKELGIGEGVSVTKVPQWNAYPVLRMANLIQIGVACHQLKICSMRLEYGATKLAGPIFSSMMSSEYLADSVASYVVGGSLSEDIGVQFSANPELLKIILNFRDTQEGINLRKEIFDQIKVAAGSEITTAINGSLRQLVSLKTMENAKSKLSSLLTIKGNGKAIWTDVSLGDKALSLWRAKSQSGLRDTIAKHGLKSSDQCLCGSGVSLSDCCLK